MRHSVFIIEVCARIDTTPALLDELVPIVRGAPAELTREDAWDRHSAAAAVVLRHLDAVERGCWEYFDDEQTAKAMFDEWCEPVIEKAVPRLGPSAGQSYRDDAGPRYMTFTVVYYLAYGSPSDLEIRRACDVPSEDLWKRATFENLLGAARMLSFASVKGDAMYLVPRDHDWSLTRQDLASPAFEYLRALAP